MVPRCRRDSDSDGIEPDPFFKQKVSLPEVLSCRAVIVVCILAFSYLYFPFSTVSLFLFDNSIRPIWNRCPGHDPRCFPRPDFPLRIFSRPQFFHNPQADRRLFSGIPDIFRTEGIPIIGRSWKRRIVLPGPDLFSKDSPSRIHQADFLCFFFPYSHFFYQFLRFIHCHCFPVHRSSFEVFDIPALYSD